MKWTSVALLVTACIGFQGTALAADVELPLRKAGKWEQRPRWKKAAKIMSKR
jgi:hypothetical protein